MRQIVKIIAVFLFFNIAIALVTSPLQVSACSCDIPADAIEGMAHSDAVFTGEVKHIKRANINGDTYDAVLIHVDEIWKGINESQVIVYTGWTSCQFEFEEGEQYLLYAYKNEDKLYVISCGRSTVMSNGAEDIKLLGPGDKPSKEVNLTFEYNKWEWIIGSIAVVALLSTAVIIRIYLKEVGKSYVNLELNLLHLFHKSLVFFGQKFEYTG